MKTNEPKFQAEQYFKGRPFYPEAIFHPLKRLQKPPTTFLDLGCGSGQSLTSFLNFASQQYKNAVQGIAIDPDPEMLALAERGENIRFTVGSAENIPLDNASVDLVLVGSAYHWFSRERAIPEMTRVLRPGGALFIFEYQFPKCLDDPSLHETIKRRFNQEWKAPSQTPRGTLRELTQELQDSPDWKFHLEDRPEWKEILDLNLFLGHLFSQSRYHHAESLEENPDRYREEIRHSLEPYFKRAPLRFDLKPRSLLFQKVDKGLV